MIPDSWLQCNLGELIIQSQLGLVRSKRVQNKIRQGIAYIKMNNVGMNGSVSLNDLVYVEASNQEKEKYLLKENDVLFNTRNSIELVGKVGIIKGLSEEIVYNNNLMRIRFGENINPQFIVYQMCSLEFRARMELVKKSTTNVAAIYAKDLFPLKIKTPSLNEQHRIVEKIEELFTKLDAAVTELKNVKKQLKRYRQSVLKSAFEGKLTEEWRKLNNLESNSWAKTNFGMRIKVSSGNGLTSRDMIDDGDYPVYGGNGINGYYNKYLFDEPKLILGRVGAKCGVVHITEKFCWVTDNALVVTFLNDNDYMKFYYYLLDYHNLNKLSVSTAQPVISGSKIYPYEVELPLFLEQQIIVEEIESRLSVADKIEEEIDINLKKTEQLRQSILKKAFEGKLVPQDPNDEPAEKLLERIKKENGILNK